MPSLEQSSPSEARAAERSATPAPEPLVVLLGNPNVGKTALFNRLTGQNARIGNYPGITVERRSGSVKRAGAASFEVVDVPGTYSLAGRSAEEQIAIFSVLGLFEYTQPSLCVAVLDAGQLARSLYLVLQLAELRVPFVIAVNMIDEVGENPPKLAALEQLFGVPCFATSARSGEGVAELAAGISRALGSLPLAKLHVGYPSALVADIDRVAEVLPDFMSGSVERKRALASWALSSVEPDDELEGIPDAVRERCLDVRRAAAPRDIDAEIVGTRWALIDRELPTLYARVDAHPPKRLLSARVDRVLLHPVLGFAAFLLVMLVVFQALFSWSDPAISAIEQLFAWLSSTLSAHLPEGVLRDLLTAGVLGGVGNVVVFLPQILLLFFFIGILEDSGYMARVAYLMDRVMKALGLHGRAFVPMLSGFACAVPAILATRTMERQRDRLLTMLVVPLMTCSARLPVYSLIVGALFPAGAKFGPIGVQSALMVGMYVFSLLTTLAAAGILGRTVVRARRVPLLLELPPYRLPNLRGTFKLVWERATVFLREAGTVILACTVVLWALLSYPKPSEPPAPAAANAQHAEAPAPSPIEVSIGGRLGKAIEPVIAPLGFDWRLGVGIVGAFAAREVFVSTLGLVYGLGDLDDEAAPLRDKMKAERKANGAPVYTPLVGLSLMVFFALSCQCMSTLAVVRRETKTLRWPAFMFAYMTGLAYLASLVVYQGGRWLGF
ncbi:MAG: ferrous iron transport protein B [Polyangiaceae bacterium]